MRLLSLRHALLLSAVLSLGACHGKDDPAQPGGSTPEAALQSSVDLLKAGDLDGLWKHVLPPADYANMRTDWTSQQRHLLPSSAAQRARFSATMQKLTAADAENTLYAKLQPKLVATEQQYQDQLPVLLSVGEAVLKSSIAQSHTLDQAQKAQADSVLDALLPWAQQAPWFDQARAKQAIGVAVTTARKLDLKDADQLQSLDFDTTMVKYATGYAGAKQLLAIYGLSIDDTLDSVRFTPVSSSNGHAVVKVDYSLLGKPLSTESKMVEESGRWYHEDLLQNARRSHQQMLQQSNVADAATATKPVTQD
ncbi:MAG: hypothetical protein ABIQ36_09860 [Rhodanobacter sp.]